MNKDPQVNAIPRSLHLKRRDVLKWMGALAVCAASPLPGGLALSRDKAIYGAGEQMFHSGCTVNCGSACFLKIFTKDGRIVRVESDSSPDSSSNRGNRACLRGRSMRQLVYSPDRIKYPMRRVAGTKRGEGKYERISWDEALETIAREWLRVLREYGPESVYRKYGSGTTSSGITNRNEWYRLANMLGGSLEEYGDYSTAQMDMAMPMMFGKRSANTASDMANARLIVMFGANQLETRASGGGVSYELHEAFGKGKPRVIVIDPRYSDTVAKVADQWIPIRPGSDAALCAAIAWVLITENLVDQEFLDKYCLGYDDAHLPEGVPAGSSYKSYVLGQGSDGVAKTPEWAARITGCPADEIVKLAREIGQVKPVCITQGYGPQRHANGDTTTRAICVLAALTGNIGIPGGNTGCSMNVSSIPFPKLPTGENPVKTAISFFTWEDAIKTPEKVTATELGLQGKEKLDHGIKFMWNSSGNSLINQHSQINHAKKTLEDDKACEFIVVVETRMTPSAKFADIILPSVTPPEQDDLVRQGYKVEQGSLLISRKAIEPLFESRSQYDICNALAGEIGKQLGQPDFQTRYNEGRSQLDWVKHLYAKSREIKPELPEDFEEANKIGWFKWFPPKPSIGFREFRENPVANPLKTPSGKIEIFSNVINDRAKTWSLPEGDALHPIPVYESTWDGPDDYETAKKYPFQLIGHHYKARAHSSYAHLPWLETVAPHAMWINTLDAETLGLKSGDLVEVFNDRGRLRVPVKVTPRIMPGVLSLPQGAWYKPNRDGVDMGACINTLTSNHPTPLAKGNPQHTNRVNVIKIG